MLKFVVVDYDAGNLKNVAKMFLKLGVQVDISNAANVLEQADVLILPGVGAFYEGMEKLREKSLDRLIQHHVLNKGRAVFGICLGMQLLAKKGYEHGIETEGLGLIDAVVQPLGEGQPELRLPHMGWNNVKHPQNSKLFKNIPSHADFYFAHSNHLVFLGEPPAIDFSTCQYGQNFTAAFEMENIYGTQFHPEKSQRYGFNLIKNFVVDQLAKREQVVC